MLIYFTFGKTGSDSFIYASYGAYCRVTGEKERDLTVDRSEKKPFFREGDGRSEIGFSLSHSGVITACAVSAGEVGLDVQMRTDADASALSTRLFGEKITDGKEFFDRFAQGEARAKYAGEGILRGMKEGGGRVIDFFEGYSCAVCGGKGPVFLQEARE